MPYTIELTPDRLTVTADLATEADIAALQRAIATVQPLIGTGANRADVITREPKQAKALRAMQAEKRIATERQTSAVPAEEEAAERIDRPAAPVVTAPEPGDQRVVVRRVTSASVPADRDEKLRQLWATDLTLQQIADKLGMGHLSNVSTRAKYLGLPSRLNGGKRRAATPPPDDPGFDPSYYARHAVIPEVAPASAARITAALMGDPSHGPSVGAQSAGMQRDGGGAV